MNTSPFVRELVSYEETRLGTSIAWSPAPRATTPSVLLCRPESGAPTSMVTIHAADGRSWPIALAALPDGVAFGSPGPEPVIPLATVRDHVVTLAFDPGVLAAGPDRALLVHAWDNAVAPALEAAARHVRETTHSAQLEAFVRFETRWHQAALDRLPGRIETATYE